MRGTFRLRLPHILLLALVVGAAPAGAAPGEPANLVTNPSFERELQGWEKLVPAMVAAADPLVKHEGRFSARVEGTGKQSGIAQADVKFAEPLPTGLACRYFGRRTANSNALTVGLDLAVHLDDGKTLWCLPPTLRLTAQDGDWTEKAEIIRAPEGRRITGCRVICLNLDSGDTAWFDDLTVIPVRPGETEPAFLRQGTSPDWPEIPDSWWARGGLCRVGIMGDWVTGYNGFLARQGLPHEVILDHQMADPEVLRRYDVVLVSTLHWQLRAPAINALLGYVRAGGAVILDSNAMPPEGVVAGARGNLANGLAAIVSGAGNPLSAWLREGTSFAGLELNHYLDAEGQPGVRVLARYQGKVGPSGTFQPAAGDAGTPAIWERPLGKGRLIYCGPALGLDICVTGGPYAPIVDALLHHLRGRAADPQLVPESAAVSNRQAMGRQPASAPDAGEDPAVSLPPRARRLRVPAGPLPSGARAVDADPAALTYDISASFLPAKGSAELFLNYHSGAYHISLALGAGRAVLSRVENGKPLHRAVLPLPRRAAVPFLLKRRWGAVTLCLGGRRAAIPAGDLWDGRMAARGAGLPAVRFQPVEPAAFGDDFMRTQGEEGAWETLSGEWSLASARYPDMGANPFTYSAKARGDGWSAAGYPFWDDYVFAAAVKPTEPGGAVGLGFYFQDPKNHLCLRACVTESPSAAEGGFQLLRVTNGVTQVLAQRAGSLVAGQWYRLSIRVRGSAIEAGVDRRTLFSAQDSTLPGGRVALFVRDGSAKFDDVQVEPSVSAPFVEGGLDARTPGFAGITDVDSWATAPTQWGASLHTRGLFWRRGRFYGDVRLQFRMPAVDAAPAAVGGLAPAGAATPAAGQPRAPAAAPSASSGALAVPAGAAGEAAPRRIAILLDGDGDAVESGYALVICPTGGAACDVALLRRGVEVARVRVSAGREPLAMFQRAGGRLLAWVDHRLALDYTDSHPVAGGGKIGFRAEGFRPKLSSFLLQADRALDYTFDQAPTDWWVGSGIWEVTNRWSCTPDWSWFGGIGRDVASIWHKRCFEGDVTLDYYVGPRMMDAGEGKFLEVCRNFNAVICGDGRSATSGYSAAIAADENAVGARLTRNGAVVATNPAFRLVSRAHRRWFNVRLEQRGGTVSVCVEVQRTLSWTDAQPLRRGYAGIWTRDNGIMVPRVTLYYQGLSGKSLAAP